LNRLVTEPSSKTSRIARDERGDRQDGQLVELLLGRDRQGVGDDDLACRARAQPVDRRAGQDRVRRGDDDALGTVGP
jgi:hypothetical protein